MHPLRNAGIGVVVFLMIFFGAFDAQAQVCPPKGNPEYDVECFDDYGFTTYICCQEVCCYDYYYPSDSGVWCCTDSRPVCCYNYVDAPWCCPSGTTCGEAYEECVGSASTTIPATSTTTTAPAVTTTTIPTATTTTVPGTATTTTVTGGGTTDGFIVGININGADEARAQTSGTLPGTSPSIGNTVIYNRQGIPVPQMYDKTFPPPDREMLERAFEAFDRHESLSAAVSAYTVGDQGSFWVKDDRDAAWRQVAATVQREGTHGILFVDDTLAVSEATLDSYITEFDIMYDVLSDNIGDFSDRDGNGKVSILLYDVNDGGTIAGYLGGYFWSKDYFTDAETQTQNVRSNEMDIIYIRGDEPEGWDQVGGDFYDYNLTTLVHEYQHLVHFGIKVWEPQDPQGSTDTWIDEMMAMASETMYFKAKLAENPAYTHPSMTGQGYLAGRIEYYSLDINNTIRNGQGLTYWDSGGDTLANYALAYLFGQYLALQSSSGQGVFKDIINYMQANSMHDYRAVAGAAADSLAGIDSWEDLLKSWAVANMANDPSGSFGYKGGFQVTPHGPTTDIARLNNGGVVYRLVTGEVSAPLNAGTDIRFYDASGEPLEGSGEGTGGPCAASQVLGSGSPEVETLRLFRDRVLMKTERGRKLVKLYYRYSPEVGALLLLNSSLRARARDVLSQAIPLLADRISGRDALIGSSLSADIEALCERMASRARPALQADLLEIRNLDFNEMFAE